MSREDDLVCSCYEYERVLDVDPVIRTEPMPSIMSTHSHQLPKAIW